LSAILSSIKSIPVLLETKSILAVTLKRLYASIESTKELFETLCSKSPLLINCTIELNSLPDAKVVS
jgi:hypothetical protein